MSSILRMKSKELNIMNSQRFNPIFTATVTPASVSNRAGKNGKYTVLSGATIARDGQADIVRTVMAFGKARDAVLSGLRKGKPVELALQHDGGSVRVIGLPRAAAA